MIITFILYLIDGYNKIYIVIPNIQNFQILSPLYGKLPNYTIQVFNTKMNTCDFCQKSNRNVQICCPSGTIACLNCLINGEVTQADQCSFCQCKFGKKIKRLLSDILHSSNSGQAARTQMDSEQNLQNGHNINASKIRGPQRRNNDQAKGNQENIYHDQNYQMPQGIPYHQNYYNQHPNYPQNFPPGFNQFPGHHYNFPPNPNGYPQNPNNWAQHPNYYHSYNPMYQNVMPQIPGYEMHHQRPYPANHYVPSYQDEFYSNLMLSANKSMNPMNPRRYQQENDENSGGMNQNNGRYYGGRMQNKTTDFLQQLSAQRDKSSSSKIVRSNSLSNLAIRRQH